MCVLYCHFCFPLSCYFSQTCLTRLLCPALPVSGWDSRDCYPGHALSFYSTTATSRSGMCEKILELVIFVITTIYNTYFFRFDPQTIMRHVEISWTKLLSLRGWGGNHFCLLLPSPLDRFVTIFKMAAQEIRRVIAQKQDDLEQCCNFNAVVLAGSTSIFSRCNHHLIDHTGLRIK